MAVEETKPAAQEVAPPPDGTRPSYIVGVGASAGGLEALEHLFERMPPETGVAFVVVQHLSPDFRSLTDELLARRTRIPIHRVENGMEVRRDAIYLIPPKKDMIVANGRLLLTDKDPAQFLALPIDHFFRSLAHDARDRAAGIVLSGTGSDGSRGIRDIHDAGGLVIAQAADSAKFDGMPRAAIETDVVDLVLAPEEMPDALLRYVRERQAREAVAQRERFLAMLSHELRNPLAAVLNAVSVIARFGPTSERAAEWYHVIERRARHMARLLDDLLDVSRLTQGKFEVRKRRVDLADAMAGVVEEARPRLDGRLHLEVEKPDTPARSRGRPGPPPPGPGQPADERRQVHPRGGAGLVLPAPGGRGGGRPRQGHGRRPLRGDARQGLRLIRAGRRDARPLRRRDGRRLDARPHHRRPARRPGRGAQRRPRRGERVRPPPAAGARGRGRQRRSACLPRVRRSTGPAAGACSSSRMTRTSAPRWGRCWRWTATGSTRWATARPHWSRWGAGGPRSP
jgi:signal transduction histidine kinase